jgi:hypothetical protein
MKKLFVSAILILLFNTTYTQVNVQRQSSGNFYTQIETHGKTSSKYDIVFIGDGFTAADQTSFNNKVKDAVTALRALKPYSENMCAFNIWRVNVISPESGIDHPKDKISKNTALDCSYGDPSKKQAERCIFSSSPEKCYGAAAYAPAFDAVFVLVNDMQSGGCAGDLVFSSITAGFADIITHELGHKIGALADEYDCYVCDGSDDNRSYAGTDPTEPNLTNNINRSTTKWASLINGATPLPTTANNPAGVVGLFEGGGYYKKSIYRPQQDCQMRNLTAFCAVCENVMRSELRGYCTACEIDPNSIACIIATVGKYILVCDCPIVCKIPPICLSCPVDSPTFDDVFTIDGVQVQRSSVKVLDDRGNAQQFSLNTSANGSTQIVFVRNRFTSYDIQLSAQRQNLNAANVATFSLKSMAPLTNR